MNVWVQLQQVLKKEMVINWQTHDTDISCQHVILKLDFIKRFVYAQKCLQHIFLNGHVSVPLCAFNSQHRLWNRTCKLHRLFLGHEKRNKRSITCMMTLDEGVRQHAWLFILTLNSFQPRKTITDKLKLPLTAQLPVSDKTTDKPVQLQLPLFTYTEIHLFIFH